MAALLVIGIGLGLRLVPLGLPYVITKYGGSVLWGAMVYLLARLCIPSARTGLSAGAAIAIAAMTEASRLYHTPDLDAFRQTLAGALLLGRIFSLWNILAYLIGIALAILLERTVMPVRVLALRQATPSSRT